jgi:hypothetical protein
MLRIRFIEFIMDLSDTISWVVLDFSTEGYKCSHAR